MTEPCHSGLQCEGVFVDRGRSLGLCKGGELTRGRRASAGALGAWGLSLLCVYPWSHMTLKALSLLNLMLAYFPLKQGHFKLIGLVAFVMAPCPVLYYTNRGSTGNFSAGDLHHLGEQINNNKYSFMTMVSHGRNSCVKVCHDCSSDINNSKASSLPETAELGTVQCSYCHTVCPESRTCQGQLKVTKPCKVSPGFKDNRFVSVKLTP